MNTIYFIVGDPAVTLTTLSVASIFGLMVGAIAAFVALRDEGDAGAMVVASAAYTLATTAMLFALPAVTLTTLSVASAFGLAVGVIAAFAALRDEGDAGSVVRASAAYTLATTAVLFALFYVPLRADMQRTEVRQAIDDALADYDGTVEYDGDTAVLTDPSGAMCQYNVELPGDDTNVGSLSPRDCDDNFNGDDN